jgi:hypothetical protein
LLATRILPWGEGVFDALLQATMEVERRRGWAVIVLVLDGLGVGMM